MVRAGDRYGLQPRSMAVIRLGRGNADR
jgi:hypothetical protein